MFVDTHCHIFKQYYKNVEEVIKRVEKNIIIVNGINDETNKEVIKLCDKYNNVYGTLGIHPSEIEGINEDSLFFIEEYLSHPKIVGIGETGLDYYWTKDNKEKQKELFIKQVKLAKKYNKAIVIHSRESIEDTYNILKKEYNNSGKIIMHCYSSSLEMAKKFINLGAMIGIGGVVTYKNANKIVDIVRNVDLNKILLETDSPFLSPEPNRGKENEPSNIEFIGKKIAEIKNISVEEVYKTTTANAVRQFDLDVDLC
jgi:TatD DNase family protein